MLAAVCPGLACAAAVVQYLESEFKYLMQKKDATQARWPAFLHAYIMCRMDGRRLEQT